jgi:hypothetical protein
VLGLFRRRKLPADARPPLDRDERVLAWAGTIASLGDKSAASVASLGDKSEVSVASLGDKSVASVASLGDKSEVSANDAVVVVTNHGLWLPGLTAARLGWHEIHKATWSGRALLVVPAREAESHETYTEMVDEGTVSITLLDPDKVPEQVRSRVTKSVAYTNHHALPGGGVRIVARRVPGHDGLRWTVRYDPGTPQAPGAVADLVAAARAAITGGQTVGPPG